MITRKIKAGVAVRGLQPEMLIADAVVAAVFEELGAHELIITSISDGKHSAQSRHELGYAVDYRRWSLQNIEEPGGTYHADAARQAVQIIKHRLRDQFDVILEESHIHVEFDPD